MEGNYQQLIEFISQNSGVSIEEIERKVEAKKAKLSDLISKEGAAQIIAAELNVNFDKQVIKISQIVAGMRKINLVGKVINIFPIREFNKNGRSGRVGSFVLADETSNTRIVLWDENHISLVEKGEIVQDRVVEITNANVRNGEIHLGSFSEIKLSEKVIENVKTEKPVLEKNICNFNTNESLCTRAFIVNLFEPKFFEVCPECRKKVSEAGECQEHGKVIPERRCLLGLVIDDGTESIRATIFSDELQKIIPKEELENSELFSKRKSELLGSEKKIKGRTRRNSMFDRDDFIVEEMEDVNLDELIAELEK